MKVAVIGAGHMGRYHAQKFAQCEGAQLVAVVDADASRASLFPACEFFTDYRKILEIDATFDAVKNVLG